MRDWHLFFQHLQHIVRGAEAQNKRLEFSQPATRGYQREFIYKANEDEDRVFIELGLPGMYGGQGSLPDYFTDDILQSGQEVGAMRGFFDLFNNRLYHTLFDIWNRYHFFTEDLMAPKSDQAQMEAHFINRLAGFLRDQKRPVYLRGLRWNRMSIYRRDVRSSIGLLEIVGSFFPDTQVEYESFVPRFLAIPAKQKAELGSKPLSIGEDGNFLVGSRFKDITGGFRLFFRDLDFATYKRLLPGGDWHSHLAELVYDYTRGQWECHLKLELRKEEVPPFRMGEAQMSIDMWTRSKPLSENAIVHAGVLV